MAALGLCIVGSFVSTLAFILMKKAHNLGGTTSVVLQPLWIRGMACLVVGSVFNVSGLAVGDQVLVSATSSFSIIFNTILSVKFLEEPIVKSDYVAIGLMILGCLAFVFDAKIDMKEYDSAELLGKYTRPVALTFICLGCLFIITVYWIDGKIKSKVRGFYNECEKRLT